MKTLFAFIAAALLTAVFVSCNSSSTPAGPKNFCDTACLKDTIKFTGDHEKIPSVFITAKNCLPDSIIWTYKGMGVDRKTGFTYLLGTTVRMNKDFVRCHFTNSDYAWLLFNDCLTGRGFQVKLPYDKSANFSLKSSGINSFDPKFSIADNLLVNTDRGNIYIEDMFTGKKAMMTFGQKLDIDYDALHEYIDSVNVTNDRVWVKILVDKKWVEKEKKIVLE
ncbi:MAG: hypothetical protein HYZ15_16590 [Sphingobacteriales bacterium]|nr:hypothetical protein [Sphingobacteriales bacterium]